MLNMDMQRFQSCADSYGARRDRWPQRDRALFDALATTPEGVQALAQAERLDAFLDGGWEDDVEPSLHLRQRIASVPLRGVATPLNRTWRWLPRVTVVLILGLGFAVGFHRAVQDETGWALMGRLMMDPASLQGDTL
jgi:hypothetical protein